MKKLIISLLTLWAGVSMAQDPQEGWSFQPDQASQSGDFVLDLSYLNEDIAGENGFVQMSADGDSFITENGGPIRFWGVGGGDDTRSMSNTEIQLFARFLARRGVNMIRFHGRIHSVSDDIMQPNTDEVEAIWKLVAAMKDEGIYTTISPFWPNFVGNIPESWELGDYTGGGDPWAVLYFDQNFQEAYKNWLTYLYTETNPHTGVPLKDEPAVGLIQMLNEDGVFFWTIQSVKPSLMAEMERQFYDWLVEKYGSIAAAQAAWDNLPPEEADNAAEGRMGLYIIFDATQPQSGGKDKRLSDQIAFYIDVQRGFYQEVYDHLREIGCKQPINTTNWKTANSARLLDAERYTNDAADVMAVNRYYDPGHVGPNRGWRYEPGDQYVGESVLFQPHKLPVNVKQVAGKPFVMTESSWPFPHKYLAEAVFLTSAYASLTGFDTYYWFSPRPSANGFSDRLGTFHTFQDFELNFEPVYKFNIAHPPYMGAFPAAALLYRQGYVQEGATMVNEVRSLQQIQDREVPLITEESGFDPNRDSYDNQGSPTATEVAPVAYLAGKVRVQYGGNPESSSVSPQLETLLDFSDKKISSSTGELNWDYQKGQCTLNAPAAQGVTGFFAEEGETINLQDVVLNVKNDYAAISVVSMDGQPLATSEKVLVQVITRYETTGYREQPTTFELQGEQVEGFEIERTGQLPWKAANTEVMMTINNSNLKSAHLLNVQGYEEREVATLPVSGGLQLLLPRQSMYVVLDARTATVTSLEDELTDSEWMVYPNPSNGNFSISLEGTDCDRVCINSLAGKEMLNVATHGKQTLHLDTRLPAGIYLVRLQKGNRLAGTRKLLVKP